MSGPPKRSHEEGGHSSSSSKYTSRDDSVSYPSTIAFDMSQDPRGGKLPRVESRDGDRKSPLHSMYRVPSSSMNDSHAGHVVMGLENRVESRELKDNRENKVVNRDSKSEPREMFHQSFKGEKDGRFESRGDEGKEAKYEREGRNVLKSDMKMEKDVYGVMSSHSAWKEHHRVKRYPDAPVGVGSSEPWPDLRDKLHGPVDVAKQGSVHDEREHVGVNEAVGENKVDVKGDDKYKDKKRKDGKHRDWGGEDKDRNDSRSNLQVGSTSSDPKEPIREEREAERWEREKKDIPKDKERPKEREKDPVNREAWSGSEKEGAQHGEKERVERTSGPENFASEQKKPKEFDAFERESKERRKERDGDAEGERPEKRSKVYDKESDDGGTEAEGDTEREREAFSYGVQQRKRMLRPRSSPQVANREGRYRSRAQDGEGSQGKSEVSTVVYKVGECMQELVKLWKEYETSHADKNGESSASGPTLEIRIPAEHVTATNRQVRGGQLWGTDIYTYDSDLVAVFMHTGYCRPSASPPPPAIQELQATIRVLPPQESYVSTLRNNVRSRAWGAAIGCSYRVERCCIVKKGGGTIDLEPCLTHTSAVEPTLAPVAVERTMTTRAAASNALRQQRFVREVTIQYNLCNEPWIKYSINIVADKGLKKPQYTSARLKKGEVLYLETHSCRYELCFTGEKMVKSPTPSQGHETETDKSQNHNAHSVNGDRSTDGDNVLMDVFRFSRCKKPLPQKVMRSIGIPLPLEHVEVIVENVEWEDVQWSQTGVWLAGKEYPLARVHFLSPN